mmetsp:Transcript_17782/g.41851  ORF Transcript_17782/g.41851 Transcript_17782/m.41851 type:complete len:89 (+) Transcript_17782:1728-1994(+)
MRGTTSGNENSFGVRNERVAIFRRTISSTSWVSSAEFDPSKYRSPRLEPSAMSDMRAERRSLPGDGSGNSVSKERSVESTCIVSQRDF